MKRFTKITVTIVSAAVLVYTGAVIGYNMKSAEATHAVAQSGSPTIKGLLDLVNAERAQNGVSPLKEDVRLDASAQMKANDEATYGFGHISPADSPYAGKQGYELINGTGISCKTDSENIRENGNINTTQAAIDAWIASPPHHAAMIDAKYTLTGFGIKDKQIVEHFCQAP